MPVGGSVTHGVGSSTQNGYREPLLKLLQNQGTNIRMVGSRRTGNFENNHHEGWRGFRIDQIETKARRATERFLPHVVTLYAGSNDCLQDFKLIEAATRISHLTDTIWQLSPGCTIILSSLLINREPTVDQRIQALNTEIQALTCQKASEGRRIVFVNMHGDQGPILEDLVEDGTHPNDEGYQKMANIWFHGIREATSKGFVQSTSQSSEAKK